MSDTLSDEVLTEVLVAAEAVPRGVFCDVRITHPTNHAYVRALSEFFPLANPDTVAALVREVQHRREQVRTLEADNAALVAHAQEAAVLVRRWWMEPIRDDDTPERAEAFIATSEALASSPHPGAALLAEMEALRARVAELEREAEAHRLRVAEEVANALSAEKAQRAAEVERDEARAKATIWERAATIARDAALEEAALKADAASTGAREVDGDDGASWCAGVIADNIRALKSQPGKGFVDAEKVRDVLARVRAARQYGSSAYDTGWRDATLSVGRDLGLTLDGANAQPARVIGAPPRAPRPEPMLVLSCPGLAVGLSYTYVNHLARCGGWNDKDSPYQEQDEQMRSVIDEAVQRLGGLGKAS